MDITRRTAIGLMGAPLLQAQVAVGGVSLSWLGGAPPLMDAGVSWGVPWPRGTVRKGQTFGPLQSWDLAYWPDGSVKWTGFATVFGGAGGTLKVTQTPDSIEIDTGKLVCRMPKRGERFIESMTVDGRVVSRDGRLVNGGVVRSAVE